MNPYHRTATIKDALYVANNIRVEDHKEILGLGQTLGILPWSVLHSDDPVAFYDKDRPDEIMGVAGVVPDPNNPKAGIIWMLCTPYIVNKPLRFIKEARKWIAQVEPKYQYLWNLADARNHLHHKFLRMMGFKAINKVYPAPYYIPYLEIVKLCAYPQQRCQQSP